MNDASREWWNQRHPRCRVQALLLLGKDRRLECRIACVGTGCTRKGETMALPWATASRVRRWKRVVPGDAQVRGKGASHGP